MVQLMIEKVVIKTKNNMRFSLLILYFFFTFITFGQVTIKGIAPAYVGKTIQAYRILDYFSYKEEMVASTTVHSDSSFTLYFDSPYTQKIIIKSNNNSGFIFVQPNATYQIDFPEKDKYTPYRPDGNKVEIGFYNLDSTDINYKILGFQRWVDYFLGNNFHLKNTKPIEFVENMDRFKMRVEKAYKNDTSTYLKMHIKFTFASLDNIQTAASRNRYEKHDFYIKYTPVQYHNEMYMNYISDFYQKMIPRLPSKTNQAVYEAILKSSPTLMMKALRTEYTLINLRIREMVMIKSLSEIYYSDDYPQTNIITILDSLSNKCLFKENEIIAKNLKSRLTSLVPGVKAPSFVLLAKNMESKTLSSYKGKYIYFHFFDPESEESAKELPLLIEMYHKYHNSIEFVSIVKKNDHFSIIATERMESLPWDVFPLKPSNSIWESYQVESLPLYVLIDAYGYVVSSPALGPKPNGQYQTIDRTFFYIQKAMKKKDN